MRPCRNFLTSELSSESEVDTIDLCRRAHCTFLMKFLFLFALFASSPAHADFFFIQNNQIYSVRAKYSPESTSIEKARFFKIGEKRDLTTGTISYHTDGIAPLPAFTRQKTPSSPTIIVGEGCARNPMSWLKSAKVYGELKKKESAMYIQVAPNVASIGKIQLKCPTDDRFSGRPPDLAAGAKDLSFLVCSDDLNSSLLLTTAKSGEDELVISDECP
jgi:hypothetical protein